MRGGRGEERKEGVAGGNRRWPRGALGFHYAKPQMESCDRVSLCTTPAGAHNGVQNKAPKV